MPISSHLTLGPLLHRATTATTAAALLLGLCASLAAAGCGTRSIEPGQAGEPQTADPVGQGTFGIQGRLRLAYFDGVGCTLCELERPLVPGLTQRLGVVEVLEAPMPGRLRLESSDPAVLKAPSEMMDDAALRDFAVTSVAPGRAELRFYTEEGRLYDAVEVTVELPSRVALELGGEGEAIDEREVLELKLGSTLQVQPVALAQSGELMQSRAFALELRDPTVVGFAAFALAGEDSYVASRMQAGTLVARQVGETVLAVTTAGAFREYRVVVTR